MSQYSIQMMPEDYLSNHIRVFKTTAKRSSLRLTVYVQDRSIKEIIQTIIDVVSPPYRIYIGSIKDFQKECFKLILDAWFLTSNVISGLEKTSDDYKLIYVSHI